MSQPTDRRTFLKAAAVGINALVAVALGIPIVRFLLDPLVRPRRKAGFIRMAALSSIPPDKPIRVVVSADRWDAFTHHPPGPVGAVWVIREVCGDGNIRVRCLQTICPHLGCGVDYTPGRAVFACPCHASEFDLSGRRRSGPAPRGMDELLCRLSDADESGEQWIEVKYETFLAGVTLGATAL